MSIWSSDFFKYLGLGIVEVGGIGLVVYFGIRNINENSKSLDSVEKITESLTSNPISENFSTEDLQYQFLYKLAQKVFPYLKQKNSTSTGQTKKVEQDDLISWLASEFGQEDNSKEDTWQNFKSLCEAQKPKDDEKNSSEDEEDNVLVPASRVCYVDKGSMYTGNSQDKYEKGNLGLWESNTSGYLGFGNWEWYNLKLWDYFRDKYPKQSPLEKFDEWYEKQTKEDATNKTTSIKNRLDQK